MICPSCSFTNVDGNSYCGRCRLPFTSLALGLVHFRDHMYWLFRRAGAGFSAGTVAWFFIPALSRVISQETSPALHFALTGLLGGAFLGTVDGMVDESAPKSFRGAVLGGVGGALGGYIFGAISEKLTPEQTLWGIRLFWAVAGGLIGLVSALWERRPMKIAAGLIAGFIGGGIGGALGYGVYANLVQEFTPEGWLAKRLMEGLSGGIIGITLWFSIGVAERFVIFKRKVIEGKGHKHCDRCETQNPLNSWYCGKCGSVLQQAAKPEALHLSPFITLERLRGWCRYLSRLSGMTGIIAGLIIFVVFLPIDPYLAVVISVIVAVASYSLLVLFSSLAESIQILTRR